MIDKSEIHEWVKTTNLDPSIIETESQNTQMLIYHLLGCFAKSISKGSFGYFPAIMSGR